MLLLVEFERGRTWGGGWSAAHDRFLEEHARTWLPRLAEKTAAETREPFYRAAAGLLAKVV